MRAQPGMVITAQNSLGQLTALPQSPSCPSSRTSPKTPPHGPHFETLGLDTHGFVMDPTSARITGPRPLSSGLGTLSFYEKKTGFKVAQISVDLTPLKTLK